MFRSSVGDQENGFPEGPRRAGQGTTHAADTADFFVRRAAATRVTFFQAFLTAVG